MNEALTMTDKAIEQNERDSTTFTNITYHQLRRTRADLLVASGKNAEAKKELNILTKDLRKRGVNQPILDEIDAYARSI
jgi:hypothetical protein